MKIACLVVALLAAATAVSATVTPLPTGTWRSGFMSTYDASCTDSTGFNHDR